MTLRGGTLERLQKRYWGGIRLPGPRTMRGVLRYSEPGLLGTHHLCTKPITRPTNYLAGLANSSYFIFSLSRSDSKSPAIHSESFLVAQTSMAIILTISFGNMARMPASLVLRRAMMRQRDVRRAARGMKTAFLFQIRFLIVASKFGAIPLFRQYNCLMQTL